MKNELKNIVKGKIVIVGIGNILRGDDSFGPVLIEKLNNNVNAVCIDAGSAPENYAGKIIKENPDTILIVDIVHLDLKPGDWQILRKEDIVKSGFTTHDLSPSMFIEYIESQTDAEIYMLGIQPQNIIMGEEMSDIVKNTLDEIEKLIKEAINA